MRLIAQGSNDESLIKYPCDFPIKIIGKQHPDFCSQLVKLVQEYDASFNEQFAELGGSKNGNYIGLTVTIRATSRVQLDALYNALCHHPLVKLVF